MSDLAAKLAAFDRCADTAVDLLLEWIERDRAALIAAARGRLVEGHYRYGDRLMYEYTDPELQAETCQELADAINYTHLRVQRSPVQLRSGRGHNEPQAEPEGSVA